MPGASDGFSSSIVYKFTSLRYIFCVRYDYLRGQNSAGRLFKEQMFCTKYAFLPGFLRFVQNVWKANAGIFFLVYFACMNFFFSLNFPLHEFFLYIARPPTPPPPHNFSNGPSLTKMTRQGTGTGDKIGNSILQ